MVEIPAECRIIRNVRFKRHMPNLADATRTEGGFAVAKGRKLEARYDVFICYASEDRRRFVRPLAKALDRLNLAVWYDEFRLQIGDSLSGAIDRGIAASRIGVVVLSPHFFEKRWPQSEVRSLISQAVNEMRPLVPIWLDVTAEDVTRFSPLLADRVALKASDGVPKIAKDIQKRLLGLQPVPNGIDLYVVVVELDGVRTDLVTILPMMWLIDHGYGLPTECILGSLKTRLSDGGMHHAGNVHENLKFVRFLHAFLAEHVFHDPNLHSEASRIGQGVIMIIDGRTPTPQGEVPSEDVFGYVVAQEGKLIPGSYRRNPHHRLFGQNGLFKLPVKGLEDLLIRELERRASETDPSSPTELQLRDDE